MSPDREALERFASIVASEAPPVAPGCALIAVHLGADTTVERCSAELDALAVAVGVASGPSPALDEIASQLHGPFGFRGNRRDYHDPRNSLLPDVLRRRSGIPITLGLVLVEVASRLGVSAALVGMPGHVLVGDGPRPRRWIDPFDGGGWLDAAGAAAIFERIHGGRGRFDAGFLAPTPPRLVLVRILENLIRATLARGEITPAVRAMELRDRIPGFGERPSARIELAEAYAAVGRWSDAAHLLEVAAKQLPPERRRPVERRAHQLRASAS